VGDNLDGELKQKAQYFGGVMSERLVKCRKLGKELPGLEKPPFPGEIGQKIFNEVSAQAWLAWRDDLQIKVLNEYRLNMADPRDYQTLVDQMLMFLNLKEGEVVEVENAERGKA
jgi:Fe-S cluster biosynthesis and repair protein YggX